MYHVSQCRNLIDRAIGEFGKIDILILNAGISAHFLFEEVEDLGVFRKLMDVNFFGYLYPTRYALQSILKFNRYALKHLK